MSDREELEKAYADAIEERDKAAEKVHEAKQALDEALVAEGLAAEMGVDSGDLTPDEIEALKAVAAKRSVQVDANLVSQDSGTEEA